MIVCGNISFVRIGHLSHTLLTLCRNVQTAAASRKTVIILGTGWGSYSVLRNLNKNLFDVIVVSPRNHFLFTPLLCSTTVGTLEFRSITEPVRNFGFRDSHHFHLAEAMSVDLSKCVLHCRSVLVDSNLASPHTYSLSYDKLIIGIGSLPNTFNLPGVKEHALFLKEISDAQRIRERLISNFELSLEPNCTDADRARLLHVIIVGGGPTGVEFGAELYDFVRQDLARLYGSSSASQMRVTLIESSHLLASFDPKLRDFAERKLRHRQNFELLKDMVTSVTENTVHLKSGLRLASSLVVWSTGLAPRPFAQSLPVPKSEQGKLLTDNYLRLLGDANGRVFALGDCAAIRDCALPSTAQVAERQGRYLAHLINESERSADSSRKGAETLQPFKFNSSGMLTYLGDYEALTQTPAVNLAGFTSWFLWRSAYLTRLGSWRLRLQVPIDWLKTMLFGRDTSRF